MEKVSGSNKSVMTQNIHKLQTQLFESLTISVMDICTRNPPVAHDYMLLDNDYFNVIYKKELYRIMEIMLNDFCWHLYNKMMITLQYWNSMNHTWWTYDFPLMVDLSLLCDKLFISLSHIWQAVISITQHLQSITLQWLPMPKEHKTTLCPTTWM